MTYLDKIFSHLFSTFKEWQEAPKKRTTKYEERIKRYMEKHPGATLAEARGHRPKTMYRTAFGIKQMPLNHKYYGVVFYAWSNEALNNFAIDRLYDLFRKELADYLGYGEGEWWFSIFEQANYEMRYRPELIGKWRFKVDYRGVTRFERQGDY